MVAVTRTSKAKRPDLSSSDMNQFKDAETGVSSSRVKDAATGVSSSRVKDTTPHKLLAQSQARLEIPKELYEAIVVAAHFRDTLKTDENNTDSQRQLHAYEGKINDLAIYLKSVHQLPASWEYNHKNLPSTYVAIPFKGPKPRKKKRTIARLPTINGTLFNEEEQKVWMKFETMNKKKANLHIIYPMKKIQIAVTDPVVNLILDFAVEAFNDSYHKYVKEHRSKNINLAEAMECKYYKMTSRYYFYVIIDAMEQEKRGMYEAVVECDRATGARTLCLFKLITASSEWSFYHPTQYEEGDRSFVSEYEEAWSSDSSGPEDFYKISGMVRRRETRGCGFDYYNPSSPLHRYVLDDGRKPEGFGRG